MKKVYKDRIINKQGTDLFDSIFEFDYLDWDRWDDVEVIFMRDLLQDKKNTDLLSLVNEKPAMWSNVYAPKDELFLFAEVFEKSIKEKKRVHIVWVTLKEEIEMLEEYYETLGFLREDINCFDVDFSVPYITVSVHIENLIWKWSDYKRMWKSLFLNPPIRESWQCRAMFKGINRWVISGIYIQNYNPEAQQFLQTCITEEKILPRTLSWVLCHNLTGLWFEGEVKKFLCKY